MGLLEVLSQRAGTFDPGDAKVLDMLSRPVIGALFAETPSGTLGKSTAGGIRGRDRESREQNGRFALSPRDVLDLQYLDRQRRRLAQGIRLRGLPLHLRAVLAVAAADATTAYAITDRELIKIDRAPPPAPTTTTTAPSPNGKSTI